MKQQESSPFTTAQTAGKSFEKNYILHGKRYNSLLKSLALQQRVSLFNSKKLLLNKSDGIQHYEQKFKHPNRSNSTANTTLCVATKYSNIFKPDYILLILTRNQLSWVVR